MASSGGLVSYHHRRCGWLHKSSAWREYRSRIQQQARYYRESQHASGLMDDTFSGQYEWLSREVADMHNHEFSSQLPRNSVSTFSSECSSRAPSVFSNSARYSQALSVASSQTSNSSSSAQSAYSGVFAYSTGTSGSIPPNGARLLIRPSPKEKKATNPYSCSHCNETFSKRADRKKHILTKCPYLGQGSLCASCPHIGRNKHQVDRHQRSSGHRGSCTIVDARDKHAFTCSNDGRIYQSLEEYIDHFSCERCQLNRAGATRHHRSRLRTLLSEGRDDANGHSYIYAAFVDYCRRRDLLSGFNNIIDRLSEDAAQAFAERLEWGYISDYGTDQARLGYTSFGNMVEEIMTWSSRHGNTAQSSGVHQSSVGASQQHPMSQRRQIPQQSIPPSKPLPSTPASQAPHTLQSAAVTEASAMLRGDLVLRHRPEQRTTFETATYQQTHGYKAKRPRSLATSQQQEATIRTKSVNMQPSPIGNGRQAVNFEQLPDSHLQEVEDDLDALIDWPEQYSLTPPPTSRNLSLVTNAQMETPNTRTSNEKRHAGIWEWSFDDFVLFEEHE